MMTRAFRLLPWMSFVVVFCVYLYTAAPGVAPYRDAGEMATALPTLGILHPTSYPVYSLTGKLFSLLPLSNPAYRLNVMSAVAMAVSWMLLFAALRPILGAGPVLVAVLLSALSYEFWWHALVSEMYTLHILFLSALLFSWARNQFLVFSFLLGVGLANRADLLLSVPAFVALWQLDPDRRQRDGRTLFLALGLLLLGLSLYLYLPIRAGARPWMNWNDPSSLESLLRTLLRKGYGGGLDLLSQNYAAGAHFVSQMKLYGTHLWQDYLYVGIPLAILGCISLFGRHRSIFCLISVGWLITGPGFIWLGNLPPNSHAVAIMEAAYLMPDFFVVIAMAAGVAMLVGSRIPEPLVLILALAGGFLNLKHTWADVSKRSNYLAMDLVQHVRMATPPYALVVSRKDVPLFSMYYGHWISQAMPSRLPLSQGLLKSPWYQRMIHEQEPGMKIQALETQSDWVSLSAQNPDRPLYALNDIDWPSSGMDQFIPAGIANFWPTGELPPAERERRRIASAWMLSDLYAYRGPYVYGQYRDFFSNEMCEYYAKAWMPIGTPEAWMRAWALKPDWPYPPLQLGYYYFRKGDFARAEHYYLASVSAFDAYVTLANRWKTLPDVKQSIVNDQRMAQSHLQAAQAMLPKGKP